jgi:hypothetical protein
MRVIANRQITGEYGTALPGQAFEVRDELAEDLMRRTWSVQRHRRACNTRYGLFGPTKLPR